MECDTHKNVRANRVETVQTNNEKTKQRVTCSKSSVVVAPCLLPTGKYEFWEKLLISKRNRKQKGAVKVVANGVHTAKLETESHL